MISKIEFKVRLHLFLLINGSLRSAVASFYIFFYLNSLSILVDNVYCKLQWNSIFKQLLYDNHIFHNNLVTVLFYSRIPRYLAKKKYYPLYTSIPIFPLNGVTVKTFWRHINLLNVQFNIQNSRKLFSIVQTIYSILFY